MYIVQKPQQLPLLVMSLLFKYIFYIFQAVYQEESLGMNSCTSMGETG
jgi:hypothetical protein